MRLRREGKKKQPFYRVVVADSRSPRDGRYIEDIGYYQPTHDPSTISIDSDRALHWLRNGAQPSEPVVKLLRIEGIWEQFKPGDIGRDRTAAHERKAAEKQAKAEAARKAEEEQAAARRAAAEEEAAAAVAEAPAEASDETVEQAAAEVEQTASEESPGEASGEEGEEA
jgi:small subunit ribosomal protein S16